jgi:hypothetical protein
VCDDAGTRPLPTADVEKVFEELRQELVSLVDLQSSVEKKQYEVTLLRQGGSVLKRRDRDREREREKVRRFLPSSLFFIISSILSSSTIGHVCSASERLPADAVHRRSGARQR